MPEANMKNKTKTTTTTTSSTEGTTTATDFTNMVIFCKHPSSPAAGSTSIPLTFRPSTPSDWLGSGARRQYLYPRPELEIREEDFYSGRAEGKQGGGGQILRRGQTGHLEMWHRSSAVGHWQIMRTVLRDRVWENW